MTEIFGKPLPVIMGQMLIGLINGSFYALLSLGLAVIFGLLNIINFTHGAQYMMGAFAAYFLLNKLGVNYWWALLLAPLAVGATGVVVERLMLSKLYKLDHLYGLLLTFGLALIFQGAFRHQFGSAGLPYSIPESLAGGQNLGFMFLPNYRAWVIVASLTVCIGTWFVIERTKLGAYLRAATENPAMVQAFGVNVPRMITLTYGFGVALAALAGVMAAPIYQVNPLMGAVVTGFGLGIIEGLTKVFYPEASNTVIFVIMAIVLMIRPQGLFGSR
jgi:branched-chain amino acid transport system permease protein